MLTIPTTSTTGNDMIYLDRFSPETRYALSAYFAAHSDFSGSLITPEKAAWLWFKLRQEPDSAELFPKGKWATLQVLEAMLDAAAKEASGQ
jgi:hypothetical protein